jgi:hypothetical protein
MMADGKTDLSEWNTRDGVLLFDALTSYGVALSQNQVILRVSYATSQDHLDDVRAKAVPAERVQVSISPKSARELGETLIRYAQGLEAHLSQRKPN